MASCSTKKKDGESIDWAKDMEVLAFHRQLADIRGDATIGDLPVESEKSKVADMLNKKRIVAISAPPGSGVPTAQR
jgi:hypothetical protein